MVYLVGVGGFATSIRIMYKIGIFKLLTLFRPGFFAVKRSLRGCFGPSRNQKDLKRRLDNFGTFSAT